MTYGRAFVSLVFAVIACASYAQQAAPTSPDQRIWLATHAYAAGAEANPIVEVVYAFAAAELSRAAGDAQRLAAVRREFEQLLGQAKAIDTVQRYRDFVAGEVTRRYGIPAALPVWDPYRQYPLLDTYKYAGLLRGQFKAYSGAASLVEALKMSVSQAASREALDALGRAALGLPAGPLTLETLQKDPRFSAARPFMDLVATAQSAASLADVLGPSATSLAAMAQLDLKRSLDALENAKRTYRGVADLVSGGKGLPTIPDLKGASALQIAGTARAIAALAATLGDRNTARIVTDVARVAEIGAQVSQLATVLAAASPGIGTFTAMSGLLGAFGAGGPFGQNEDQAAQQMKTLLAEVTRMFEYMKVQFQVVNAKLDYLVEAVDAIRGDLRLIQQRLDVIAFRLGSIDASLDAMRQQLDSIATDVTTRPLLEETQRCKQAIDAEVAGEERGEPQPTLVAKDVQDCLYAAIRLGQEASRALILPPAATPDATKRSVVAAFRPGALTLTSDHLRNAPLAVAGMVATFYNPALAARPRIPHLTALYESTLLSGTLVRRYQHIYRPGPAQLADLTSVAVSAEDARTTLSVMSGTDGAARAAAVRRVQNVYQSALRRSAQLARAIEALAAQYELMGKQDGPDDKDGIVFGPKYVAPLRDCSDTALLGSMHQWSADFVEQVPAVMSTYGGPSRTASLALQVDGGPNNALVAPLRICVATDRYRDAKLPSTIRLGSKPLLTRVRIGVDLKVFIGGEPLMEVSVDQTSGDVVGLDCSTFWNCMQNSNTGPVVMSMLQPKLLERLSEKITVYNVSSFIGGALMSSESREIRSKLTSRVKRLLQDENTPFDLGSFGERDMHTVREVFLELDYAAALLRAHMLLALPQLHAGNDAVFILLNGMPSQRIADREYFDAVTKCDGMAPCQGIDGPGSRNHSYIGNYIFTSQERIRSLLEVMNRKVSWNDVPPPYHPLLDAAINQRVRAQP